MHESDKSVTALQNWHNCTRLGLKLAGRCVKLVELFDSLNKVATPSLLLECTSFSSFTHLSASFGSGPMRVHQFYTPASN